MKYERVIITVIISILLLMINELDGGRVGWVDSECLIIGLTPIVFFTAILILTLSLVFTNFKWSNINDYFVGVLIAGILMVFLTKPLKIFQDQRTGENLRTACDEISKFKNEHSRVPHSLEELYEERDLKPLKSAYFLFNSEFQYSALNDTYYQIVYKIANGFHCSMRDCEEEFPSVYSCITCTGVTKVK